MMALEEFKAINLVLPVSVECHKEFQKETKIASPWATSSSPSVGKMDGQTQKYKFL